MKALHMLSCVLCLLASDAAANEKLVRVGDFFHRYSQAAALGYTHWQHGFEGSISCFAGIAANNAATRVLKRTINQPRPRGGPYGMPSGHTSRVASSFGCMLGQEGWTTPTLAFGAATVITAYSRVEGGYHTTEQVLAGALLGTTLGYFSTQHLYVAPDEIGLRIPLGGHAQSGPQVSVAARKALIAYANNR